MKKKDELGGPGSKKVIVLVDDVNMPARGLFGAQPAVELLRQYCDAGCFHKDNRRLTVVDTTLICVAAPRGGERTVPTARFMRHLQSFSVPDSSEELQLFIFKSVMGGDAVNRFVFNHVTDLFSCLTHSDPRQNCNSRPPNQRALT